MKAAPLPTERRRSERSHSRATLPPRMPGSTIAEAGLNFRVRNGNGCGPRSLESGKTCDFSGCRDRLARGRAPSDNRTVIRFSEMAITDRHCTTSGASSRTSGQAARAISTGQLHALLRFHLRPIASSSRTALQGTEVPGRSHLGVGFPLRCFQRLSHRHLATRRCSWRNNRYTRGASVPVLSY